MEIIEQEKLIVKAVLAALPDSLAIYRFGSWGTSAQRPDSDIAVLPQNRPVDILSFPPVSLGSFKSFVA